MISRGSGRSATGAAAYRAGEKLTVVRSAAYRSGEDLGNGGVGITHDYTQKSGVVYKGIILSEGASPEYADRQTLWNAVEKREKRADAQLAREINVALPTAFDLEEQKALLREYIEENFVDKGMIADFAIHHMRAENPHAHIMLTTRTVTPDGFGNKNRDWNSRQLLVCWRESWADKTNRMLEEKGLEERIDHRTLKAQGIDREPTIHLGHEAAALEKKGVQTERGNYNREIAQRNDERAVKKAAQEHEFVEKEANSHSVRNAPKNSCGDAERSALMVAKRNLWEIEAHLKAEKAAQIADKIAEKMQERQKIAEYMCELQENYVALDKELYATIREVNEYKQEIPQLDYLAESMDEHAQNIDVLHGNVAQMQAERQNLRFWKSQHKNALDKEIALAEENLRVALHNFKENYGIDYEQAPAAIKRIREKNREKENERDKKNARISTIRERQGAIELDYHTQKLLNEIRPDRQQIEKLLEKMNKSPESVRDRLLRERIVCRLNTVSDENFQKVIEKLPEKQAKILIITREQAKERKLLVEAEKERILIIEQNR
ncbi:MAG: MobA/MobL family protein [Nitrososphaerota archaeon]|jgi:hypothetical protein|nr:MobA/MobL family protein [Nitrososphaerota archaeon]